MAWPLSQDYNEALQNPQTSFSDAELRRGQVVVNVLGIPQPCSGNFADVYAVECSATRTKWAVKCFTREVHGLRERYSEISKYLQQTHLPFTVDFQYLEQGVRIAGRWYPILKMHWVEGFTLNAFVRDMVDKPAMLEGLSRIWLRMAQRLREAKLAHADLQHGNVLLVPGSNASSLAVKLIDYDGMWVPSLASKPSGEIGHPSYQHPQRLREGSYTQEIDRFPLLAIYVALRALVAGGRPLWERYDNGDNLLFRQADFEAPAKSPLFAELLRMNQSEVHDLAANLIDAARKPLEQVAHLSELVATETPSLSGANIPSNASSIDRWDSGRPEPTRRTSSSVSPLGVTESSPEEEAPIIVRKRRRRQWSKSPLLALGISLVVFGSGLFLLWRLGSPKNPSTQPALAQTRNEATSSAPKKQETPPSETKQPSALEDKNDSPPDDPPSLPDKPKPEDATPPKTSKPEDTPPKPAEVWIEPLEKKPVPIPALLVTAEREIWNNYKTAYSLRKPEDRRNLAQKLLRRAQEADESSARRFVLFQEARNLAADAVDTPLALEAAKGLTHHFTIDPQEATMEALEWVCQQARVAATANQCSDLGNGWWDLAQSQSGFSRDEVLRRAFFWYEYAFPDLPAPTQALVGQRLRLLHDKGLAPPTDELRIVAIIDGKDTLHLTNAGGHWVHHSAQWPTIAYLNYVAWKPHEKPTLDSVSVSSLLRRQPNFSTAWLSRHRGRGGKQLTAAKDSIRLTFDDERPRGADTYDVTITFAPVSGPVPGEVAQGRAERLLKELERREHVQGGLTKQEDKGAKLLASASRTKDDPAMRFVLLRQARDSFAESGDSTLALKSAAEMSARFALDDLRLKAVTLELAGHHAVSKSGNKTIAEHSLALIEESVRVDDYEVATRLLNVGEKAASGAGTSLVEAIQSRGREVVRLKKEWDAIKSAFDTLAKQPKDPEANRIVGRFRCFQKGDWARGLPLLILGDDDPLKQLAEKDLAAPASVDGCVELGNGWWQLAGKPGIPLTLKGTLQQRACHWYERALPDATKARRTQMEKHIRLYNTKFPALVWGRLDISQATAMNGVLRLSKGDKEITTRESWSGGIEITVIARTEKNNIRLRTEKGGCVIFNWENKPKELRITRPDGTNRKESGSLATAPLKPLLPNTWYLLSWRITENGMTVSVNGHAIFSEEHKNDLSAKQPIHVCSADSDIEVLSFTVRPIVKKPD
jgi:hypothetical protein